MALWPFVITLFGLVFFMSLGKAAVYRHIPVYYPKHVGSVGGLVGMIGGLGGFFLPIVFGALLDLTGIWTSAFADRKSTRLNSSHVAISYAVFCLKKKKDLRSTH